jgi:hypothetical protein
MSRFEIPLIIRGRIIEGEKIEFGGRRGGATLVATDVRPHIAELPLRRGSDLADLYALSFDEIVDYLLELGERLDFSSNAHLQEAYRAASMTSGLTGDILANAYSGVSRFFSRDVIHDWVERTVGIDALEGWVERKFPSGGSASVRAFGARGVHVVAGNSPAVSMLTIAQNAITRSDAIIKAPSNDPLTAAAIARTMIDIAPDHPITRHLSVAYWKGGDAAVEDALYQPKNIEKLVAWGGFASVTHIAKYVQPGIDLITLDPKLSSTIIGEEAFESEEVMEAVAERLANDVGCMNQEGCVNARVIYIHTGTDREGLGKANRFGAMLFAAIQALPAHVSGVGKGLPRELADEMEGLRYAPELYKVSGGGAQGAVIVSQCDEPVDFARLLGGRVANLVPVDSIETPILAVTAYTQTIGIYPESLKKQLRDRLGIQGAQRLVSLGYATGSPYAGPQDAIEPLRRVVRWVVEESYEPSRFPFPSRRPAAAKRGADDRPALAPAELVGK